MKKLFLILSVALVALTFQGCAGFGGSQAKTSALLSSSSASAVVINAEKALRESKDTIDLFLHLEYNHQAFIKAHIPVVHVGAEALRRQAPAALIQANKAKNVFKHNRTEAGEVDLMSAVANVVQLAGQAKAYTETLNASTP